jgi:AcrR family transcriptional regulator
MSERPAPARERIVKAATHLFYLEGIRAVSVDAVAERAGVTKKTLYYHFASKDELITEYLARRDQPNLVAFGRWWREAEGTLPERVEAFFDRAAEAARHPKWKGCGFLRTVAELAGLPGHPARKIGAAHKRNVERWLEEEFRSAGIETAGLLSRQVAILLDGAFMTMLVHRDADYARTAGSAARALVERAMVSGPPA